MNVTIYAGLAGDRNSRAMHGSVAVGTAIATALDSRPNIVGSISPPIHGGWATQLHAASPDLKLLANQLAERLKAGDRPISTMGRCAASIATLPQVAARFPNSALVWFDAHGDCNLPTAGANSQINYLGGMVLTGAAGEWSTGFGAGLDLDNVILVGARDLDPPERDRVASGQIRLVVVGPDLPRRLKEAVGNRSIYVHIDCDVLNAGLLATEYQSPGGLTFDDLHAACAMLSSFEIIGLEITEYEESWPDGRPNAASDFISAIRPLLTRLNMTPVNGS
jgi:arginase